MPHCRPRTGAGLDLVIEAAGFDVTRAAAVKIARIRGTIDAPNAFAAAHNQGLGKVKVSMTMPEIVE